MFGILSVFILCPLLFSSRRNRTWTLSSKCKIDQVDFPDRVSFLSSKFLEINPSKAALSENTVFLQHGIIDKMTI